MIRSIAIVGGGRTGRALGRLSARVGIEVRAVFCRTPARAAEAVAFIGAGTPVTRIEDAAGADAVLVAVSDDALREVAGRLARVDALRLHVCGAVGHEVFGGGRAAAVHPLRSFADPAGAVGTFAGTFCFWDAAAGAKEDAVGLIRAWGGRPVEVRAGGKALYHAGAVFASNYVVALMDAAEELLLEAGVEAGEGREAAQRLLEGVVANLRRVGTAAALTGPVERGDAGTVAAHRDAMAHRPDLRTLYDALGRRALRIARAKGSIDAAAARRIGEILDR